MKGRGPSVHIIAGRWKRRRLDVPPRARPSSGRAREALFSILGERIAGARVLDLYAGSGAIGLEAASRGASRAVIVEKRAEALARTIARFDPDPEQVRLLAMDAVSALDLLAREGEKFDFIFADPPYGARVEAPVWRLAAKLLDAGGVFIIQSDSGDELPAPPGLARTGLRPYGRNVFLFFARAPLC